MNKIKTAARVTEVDTVSDALVRLYKADSAITSDDYLKSVVAEIEEYSEKITAAIKSDKTASTLDEADTTRDEIIRSLGTLLNGYAVIPVADKKLAAEKLLAVFTKYKGITSKSYANESSLIESMIQDFSAASLSDSVNALEGVSTYLADLRSAQDAFNTASDAYTAAKTSKGESATSIKKPLLSVINDTLIPYLTVMTVTNSAVYGDFATKLEAEIDKLNATITKRTKTTATTATETTE